MKSNLFNLLSLLVVLTLLLTTSGTPVTAQAKPSNHNTAPESPSDTAGNIPAAVTPSDSLPSTRATQARIEQSFGKLPLYFVENQGQLDERVADYIQGSDKRWPHETRPIRCSGRRMARSSLCRPTP